MLYLTSTLKTKRMSLLLLLSKPQPAIAKAIRWLFMGGFLLIAPWATSQDLVSVANGQLYAGYQPWKVVQPAQSQSLKLVLTELESKFNIRFVYESNLVERKQLANKALSEQRFLFWQN